MSFPTESRLSSSGKSSGAVAQLGERLLCKQEVIGSIPFSSTISIDCRQRSTFVVLSIRATSVESCKCSLTIRKARRSSDLMRVG